MLFELLYELKTVFRQNYQKSVSIKYIRTFDGFHFQLANHYTNDRVIASFRKQWTTKRSIKNDDGNFPRHTQAIPYTRTQ